MSSNSSGIVRSPVFYVVVCGVERDHRPWGTAEFIVQKAFLKYDGAANLAVGVKEKEKFMFCDPIGTVHSQVSRMCCG